MLAMRSEAPYRLGPQRVHRVPTATHWSDRMHLVDDQQVELAGGTPMIDTRQHLVQQRLCSRVLQPVDRDDETGKRREHIRSDATIAPELANGISVHDPELQSEPLEHLLLPLHNES